LEASNKNEIDQLDFLNTKLKNFSEDKNFLVKNKDIAEINHKNKLLDSILILDTETTGLDEKKDEVIEVGCILFHISSKSVLSQLSFLLPVNNNNAESINGISADVSRINQPWRNSINLFMDFVSVCDLIVAHNVEFDKKWFGKGHLPNLDKRWVCSLDDIDWSFKKNLKRRPSVTDLALAFNIPVWSLHRALSDCYYLSEVFKKLDNLEDLLVKASEPRFLYKAIVSYEERTLAKNAGFRWNSPIQGAWTRKLSEKEAVGLDFQVQILN
tara:strand:- start:3449 stop:4258 length:810 start_codon:yes stop_codon:yes gene_type:complete